ncbi:hypothetical protein A0H81_12083 [Grifola frondosa]|uniref:Uncharacterized protein n=1 Tax=Grifola frondosa TaxID=5627 RepID=A0A1C7LTF7_GRIFR|nr:hypothetical protein A0H81_12083 [Grifola frondosa]
MVRMKARRGLLSLGTSWMWVFERPTQEKIVPHVRNIGPAGGFERMRDANLKGCKEEGDVEVGYCSRAISISTINQYGVYPAFSSSHLSLTLEVSPKVS